MLLLEIENFCKYTVLEEILRTQQLFLYEVFFLFLNFLSTFAP